MPWIPEMQEDYSRWDVPACVLHQDAFCSCTGAALTSLQPRATPSTAAWGTGDSPTKGTALQLIGFIEAGQSQFNTFGVEEKIFQSSI